MEGISKSQRKALGKRCSWHTYAEGEQIIDRHDDNRDVYFIVEGQVRIVNYSLSGREIAFDDLGKGDYFGELAAIDDGPRSANVVAQAQTTVAMLGPVAFAEFLHDHPSVALKVMKRLTYVVRQASERIMDLSTLGANNRIYAELLRQAMTSMKSDNSAEIQPIPNHSEIAFDDLRRGDYFGELAAIDDGPRSANVVAQAQTTVAMLGPVAFAEFLHDHPSVALKVMRRLTYIVRQASERIMDLSTLGANNRIYAELLRQAMTSMKPDNSAEIRPIPNHSQIASRVSTTRETVARVLSDLARDNVVKRGRNALVIPDIHRLAGMVEEVRGD